MQKDKEVVPLFSSTALYMHTNTSSNSNKSSSPQIQKTVVENSDENNNINASNNNINNNNKSSLIFQQHHHSHANPKHNPVRQALLPDEQEDEEIPKPVPWMHGAAGICGGAFSMSLFYPLDLIRTRMHTYTGKPGETSKLRGAIESIRQDGLKVMFRGVKIAVISHSFGWGMYLTVFRTLQQKLAKENGGDTTLGDFVSACGAAGVTSAVVTPLNFLKTNIQLASAKEKVTAKSILKKTIQEQGVFALMRGLGPQFLLSSHTTIQVALYELIKRWMWSNPDGKGGHQEAPMYGVALASAVSKGFASALCNPLEVCRTRLQDTRNAKSLDYASMGQAFRTIWNSEGYRGLYRGVTVNVCRVVPTTVVAFVMYETILSVMHRASLDSNQIAKQNNLRNKQQQQQ